MVFRQIDKRRSDNIRRRDLTPAVLPISTMRRNVIGEHHARVSYQQLRLCKLPHFPAQITLELGIVQRKDRRIPIHAHLDNFVRVRIHPRGGNERHVRVLRRHEFGNRPAPHDRRLHRLLADHDRLQKRRERRRAQRDLDIASLLADGKDLERSARRSIERDNRRITPLFGDVAVDELRRLTLARLRVLPRAVVHLEAHPLDPRTGREPE